MNNLDLKEYFVDGVHYAAKASDILNEKLIETIKYIYKIFRTNYPELTAENVKLHVYFYL